MIGLEEWFYAAETGDKEYIVQYLNTFAGSTNSAGSTALIEATRNGHFNLVKILVKEEAGHRNAVGEFALAVAILRNDVECCRLLVSAEYDMMLSERRTVLHLAAQSGSKDIIPILHQYITDSRDKSGRSALDYAVISGSLETVTVLQNLFVPDRNSIKIALGYCQNNNIYIYLKSLEDTAIQRCYDNMEDLSMEVDKLLSAIPSFVDTRLEASASSMRSDNTNGASASNLRLTDMANVSASRGGIYPVESHSFQLPSYRKASPDVQSSTIRSSSFSYSTSKPIAKAFNDLSLTSVDMHTTLPSQNNLPQKLHEKQRSRNNSTQTYEFVESTSISQLGCSEDKALLAQRLVLTERNSALMATVSDYDSTLLEKDMRIQYLEKSIEEYKQALKQIKKKSIEVIRSTQTEDFTQPRYDLSALADSVTNSCIPYRVGANDISIQQSESIILQTTQSPTASRHQGDHHSKTIDSLENQFKELSECLKNSNDQLKLFNQREQIYEHLQKKIIELSEHKGLIKQDIPPDDPFNCFVDANCMYEDAEWNSDMLNVFMILAQIRETFTINLHTIEKHQKELERLHKLKASSTEQDSYKNTIRILQNTIENLQGKLEEKNHDLEKVAELHLVKAELASLQCKYDILLKKTAKLEQQTIQRGHNETIFAEKLKILRDVQEHGYLADPAYRLLLTRCEDLEHKLQESKKQNEHLISDIITSKIKCSRLEQMESSIKETIPELDSSYTIQSRPQSHKKVRIQSANSVSEDTKDSEQPVSKQSQQPVGNFFDLQESNLLHAVPSTEVFRDSMKYTDTLTTTMLNTSVLRSNLYSAIDSDGTTPLMHAAKENDVKKAEQHMRYIGMAKPDGTTALMVAAEYDAINVAELLIKEEACMFREDGLKALDIAEACGNSVVASLLRTVEKSTMNGVSNSSLSGRLYTELMSAVETGNVRAASVLYKFQAGLIDTQGKTALMYAAITGNLEMVTLLLDKEAGKRDDEGRTALMYACMYGHPECVKALYSKEASIHDNKGNKPLRYAVDKASHGNRNVENTILEILCMPH